MFARRSHSAYGQSGDARLIATIHDDLNRFLLRYGIKWPSRFVQRGTQHSDGMECFYRPTRAALFNNLQ